MPRAATRSTSAPASALTEATGVNLSAVTFNCLIFF
jgi:hypothetical protein